MIINSCEKVLTKFRNDSRYMYIYTTQNLTINTAVKILYKTCKIRKMFNNAEMKFKVETNQFCS